MRVLNGSGKVKLSWTPSSSPNVDGYRIYRSSAYAAPTADDPWAGADAPAWTTPFGTDGDWVLVDLDGGYPRIQATLGRLSAVARGRAGAFPSGSLWSVGSSTHCTELAGMSTASSSDSCSPAVTPSPVPRQ